MKAIEVLAPVLAHARKAGAAVGFDFALYVGARPFTSSVSFSEADLNVFSGLRAGVTVSAYPVAEDEPASRKPRTKGRNSGANLASGASTKSKRAMRRGGG
jgi:hypothetical protein